MAIAAAAALVLVTTLIAWTLITVTLVTVSLLIAARLLALTLAALLVATRLLALTLVALVVRAAVVGLGGALVSNLSLKETHRLLAAFAGFAHLRAGWPQKLGGVVQHWC